MKATLFYSIAFVAGATLCFTTSIADARSYGVSSSSAGRGTKYTSSRGGSAYVGPNGVAAQGANGRTAAATKNGAAYSGPNGAGAAGKNGNYGTYNKNTGVTTSGNYKNGDKYYGGSNYYNGGRYYAPAYRYGYVRVIPAGYRTVYYGGYNCFFVGGIYYRPEFYQGTTVYVVVK